MIVPWRSVALAIAIATTTACVPASRFTERRTVARGLGDAAFLRDEPTAVAAVPPGIDPSATLTADQAVAIALWNSAPFQETLSRLGLSRAELAQAGLLTNPTLAVLFPLGPKQLEFAVTMPLEFLWLRAARVRIAKLDAERVAHELMQGGLDLARDVRVAVSDLVLARDREATALAAARVRERIRDIAEARVRAGEGSELDAESQRTEATRARDEATRLAYDVSIAEQRLIYLLGLTGMVARLDVAPLTIPPDDRPTDELERRALAARPDVRAAELAVEAAGERIGLSVAEIFTLSGIADANGRGTRGFEMGPGMQLPIPLFNQNQAGRRRADAELERAAWNHLGTQQRVLLEVRTAHLRCRQALEAWRDWTTNLVPPLEELVRASERAYEIGELPPLTVQENARQLIVAQTRQAELAADVRRAWAELERSVGARLAGEPSPAPTT